MHIYVESFASSHLARADLFNAQRQSLNLTWTYVSLPLQNSGVCKRTDLLDTMTACLQNTKVEQVINMSKFASHSCLPARMPFLSVQTTIVFFRNQIIVTPRKCGHSRTYNVN